MSERKTILVTGATGAQGGSVAHHLLRDQWSRERFNVRCLTRDPGADKVANLKQAGAQVVGGNLDDLDSLRNAMQGCWGVFGVTNFWEHYSNEYRHGHNLCDAVAEEGVQCFIFSTLPSAEKISGGELHVPHLDIKAKLEEEARGRGLPVAFVHVAYYYENFLSYFTPRLQPDGTYLFGFPQGETPLAAVSVEDVGGVVRAMFRDPEQFLGRTVGVVGDDQPPADYARIMTDVLGKTVRYTHIPRETYAKFEFPGAAELADMFEFNRRFIPDRKGDLEECRRLYPEIRSFEAWVQQNRDRFNHLLTASAVSA